MPYCQLRLCAASIDRHGPEGPGHEGLLDLDHGENQFSCLHESVVETYP